VEGGVEGDERIEHELARRRVGAVPRVLGDGQDREERQRRRNGPAQGRAGHDAPGPAPDKEPRGDERCQEHRKEPSEARPEAQPEGRGAEGASERYDEGRVDLVAEEPLDEHSGRQNRGAGEGQEE
jgi:hypothetical protein